VFRLRFHLINACLAGFDLAMSAACLIASGMGQDRPAEEGLRALGSSGGVLFLLVFFAGWLGLLSSCGLYQSRRVSSVFSDAPILFRASCVCLFLGEAANRWLPAPFSSRYFLLRFLFTTLVVLVLARTLLRLILRELRERGVNRKNVLLVSSPELGDRLAEKIAQREDYGYRIVDRLDYSLWSADTSEAFLERFRNAFRAHRIGDVILALPAEAGQLQIELVKECENLAANVRIAPDLLPLIQTDFQVFSLDGIPLISIQPYRTEDLKYIVGKRLFDIVFSLITAVCLLPVVVLVGVLIKLTSRGPVFIRQERVGMNARRFMMYKLRTMSFESLQEAETHWTIAGDPHITRLGRWLRRCNVDELPQFINVLKGDMSIVGPRPERPFFISRFQEQVPSYMLRHYAKCGITGWAQVNGWRGDTSIRERVMHDLYYIRNWDFSFDLKIMALTIGRVFFHSGIPEGKQTVALASCEYDETRR